MTSTELERPSVVSLEPRKGGALILPAGELAAIRQAFTAYQELCESLLVPADFQRIGQNDFRKKSAWRKLSVAFGVSTDLKDRSYDRGPDGKITRAEVIVTATAPNGRHADGLGAADLFEKCCPGGPELCTIGSSKHKHCRPNCPGTVHWSNSQHDVPATAYTRAANRACSDLYGMGEVSAEEVTEHGEAAADPDADFRLLGWGTKDEHDVSRQALVERLKGDGVTEEQRAAYKAWLEAEGLSLGRPNKASDLGRMRAKAEEILGAPAEAPPAPAQAAQGGPSAPSAAETAPRGPDAQETPQGAEQPCEICGSSRARRVVHDGVLRCENANDCAKRAAKRDEEEATEVRAGEEQTDQAIERVKSMTSAQVLDDLKARRLSQEGVEADRRRRLTLALLREQIDA